MHPVVVETGRGLDPVLGARDVLLLELLEVGDARHHVMALGRVADLCLLQQATAPAPRHGTSSSIGFQVAYVGALEAKSVMKMNL